MFLFDDQETLPFLRTFSDGNRFFFVELSRSRIDLFYQSQENLTFCRPANVNSTNIDRSIVSD